MAIGFTGYKKQALQALWLPSCWLILLIFELAFFSSSKSLPMWARLYEDLVFIMSFFFYSSQGFLGYLENPASQIFLSFSLQFFFWWLMAFGFLTLKKKFQTN